VEGRRRRWRRAAAAGGGGGGGGGGGVTHTLAGPATPHAATMAHATLTVISPEATGRKGLLILSMDLS
jgi:hypothetical protein